MLYRDDPGGSIGITQPAHAWVSGQLARAWGNATFGTFAPRDELILAAEQHDVGMAEWETAPTLNPRTGRPYSFLELPEPLHSQIFIAGSRLVAMQNRYAALLTSRHFIRLAGRHDFANDPPATVQAITDYLATESAWQERLLASLRDDPVYAPHVAAEALDRNSRLLAAWDWFSLLLLMGVRGPATVPDLPTATGATTLTLTPAATDLTQITIDPWSFATATVTISCEGRLLESGYSDDEALRAAMADAPWTTLQLTLRPTEPGTA
jgi:hypothetical protein